MTAVILPEIFLVNLNPYGKVPISKRSIDR